MREQQEPHQSATEWFRQALAEAERNHLREIEASALVRAELERLRQEVAYKEEQLVLFREEVERQQNEIDAIHRTLSWRLTEPLRIGKAAPRRFKAGLAGGLAMVTREAKQAIAGVIRPAVHWIVRRPRLFLLLRRTLVAHPRIRTFIKGRIVANQGSLAGAAGGVLTAEARYVLEDLEHAVAAVSMSKRDDLVFEPGSSASPNHRAGGAT